MVRPWCSLASVGVQGRHFPLLNASECFFFSFFETYQLGISNCISHNMEMYLSSHASHDSCSSLWSLTSSWFYHWGSHLPSRLSVWANSKADIPRFSLLLSVSPGWLRIQLHHSTWEPSSPHRPHRLYHSLSQVLAECPVIPSRSRGDKHIVRIYPKQFLICSPTCERLPKSISHPSL